MGNANIVTWRGGKDRGVSTVIPAELHARLDKVAAERGLSRSKLLKEIIEDAVGFGTEELAR